MAQYNKGKVIDTLKELSTIKNYITISLAKKETTSEENQYLLLIITY